MLDTVIKNNEKNKENKMYDKCYSEMNINVLCIQSLENVHTNQK